MPAVSPEVREDHQDLLVKLLLNPTKYIKNTHSFLYIQFITSIMEQEWRAAFDAARPESDGTLSAEQIVALPIRGLFHTLIDPNPYIGHGETLLPKLEAILKDGYLRDSVNRADRSLLEEEFRRYKHVWDECEDSKEFLGRWENKEFPGLGELRLDQYPGVYFRPAGNESNFITNDVPIQLGITLVFSMGLMRKKAWHGIFSMAQHGPIDTGHIYDYATLPNFPHRDYFWMGEICFHYPVSLDYCEAILYHENVTQEEIETLLRVYARPIPVFPLTEYDAAPRQYSKLLWSEVGQNAYTNAEPNYCYFNPPFYYRPGGCLRAPPRDEAAIVFNTLLNSGVFRERALEMLATMTLKECILVIQTRRIVATLAGVTYPVKVHPPHIEESSSDLVVFIKPPPRWDDMPDLVGDDMPALVSV
jgi:hypothetical protein